MMGNYYDERSDELNALAASVLEAKLAEAEKTDRRGEVAMLREAVIRIDGEKKAAIERAEAAEERLRRLKELLRLYPDWSGDVPFDEEVRAALEEPER